MAEKGIEKSGYLEVKQPSTTKGRKLKNWKKRWVVVHQMSDLTSGAFNAKVDIYPDEASSLKTPSDKMTFVVENITAVRLSKSKTHLNAFEVVESEPVLVFCAATEQETSTWMSIYQRICQHDSLAEYDIFGVHILQNPHSQRLNLPEKILLSISTSVIRLLSHEYNTLVEWRLSAIKRFYTIENAKDSTKRVLVLECGPNAETGEGMFCFSTPEWELILKTIRKNISMAITERERLKSIDNSRDRAGSATNSVYQFSNLLENSDNPTTMTLRTVRSVSEMSEVSVSSRTSSTITPPLSPLMSSEGHFVTSTPDPYRSLRRSVTIENEPCPVFQVDDGYLEIKGSEESGQTNIKPRSGSVSSTNSSSSHRSRVSSLHESETSDSKVELSGKRPNESSPRAVSNSFDSGFSNGSYEDTKRKGSDVDKTIKEETSDKSDTANIYQELDYAKVLLRRLSDKNAESRERRHSTGDMKKEPDYEELESRKRDKGIFSDTLPRVHVTPEIPPALPDRPASLRGNPTTKSKSNWKKRLSGLSFLSSKTGHSPGNSPDRCESPLPNQRSPIIASDIVLENVNATLAKVYNKEFESQDNFDKSENEHFYQSIPDVLQQIQQSPPQLAINDEPSGDFHGTRSSEDFQIGQVDVDALVDVEDDDNTEPDDKSSPLIDFFFKDDGFERLRAQSNPEHLITRERPVSSPTHVPEMPLIDFSSNENLLESAPVRESHYIDMTNPKHVVDKIESVEYVPPSEMREAISKGDLIDI